MNSADIQQNMPIVSSDGHRLGIVSGVEGEARIKLRVDDTSVSVTHYIPAHWATSVDAGEVRIGRSAEDIRSHWDAEILAGEETS